MEENPYVAMIAAMRTAARTEQAPGWGLGVIKSVSPLRVETGGLVVGPAGLFASPEGLSSAMTGDSVVILPSSDRQELYLICKVVSV